mmetsp:Transcript_18867/g.71408  ORF Transcript_18867/g.71408 Transcript_18867/m.71408 type:complete len:227 (-) Transcript_18867:384-1064(-)
MLSAGASGTLGRTLGTGAGAEAALPGMLLPGCGGFLGPMFLQSMQLQRSPHAAWAWKHSQYFFRQPLFRHLQPRLWRMPGRDVASAVRASEPANLASKAVGFRSRMLWMAFCRSASCSLLLWHIWQLQDATQICLAAKQTQYNLRHLERLQLHPGRWLCASAPCVPAFFGLGSIAVGGGFITTGLGFADRLAAKGDAIAAGGTTCGVGVARAAGRSGGFCRSICRW